MVNNEVYNIILATRSVSSRQNLAMLLGAAASQFPYRIVAQTDSGAEALDAARGGADVIFLDTQLAHINGLETARQLLSLDDAPQVIFFTPDSNHALAAFSVHALDYLVRPVTRERLLDALARLRAIVAAKPKQRAPAQRRFLRITSHGRLLLVPIDEVIYFCAEAKYVTVVTAEKEHKLEDSLVRLSEELGDRFVRIHRNCLARADLLETFRRDPDADGDDLWTVTLRGRSERLVVSRRAHASVRSLSKRVSF